MEIRHDWTVPEVVGIFELPLEELCARATQIHAQYGAQDVQKCMLLSVKTGGCQEDCGYCSQSAHFKTDIASTPLMPVQAVLSAAKEAKENGASRFCMGAAWRQVPDEQRFNDLLKMI